MRIVTPKEGWSSRCTCRRDSVPATLSGWTLVASGEMDATRKTFPLDTAGQRSRYYLLWITKLTEGATGGSSAAISEVELLSEVRVQLTAQLRRRRRQYVCARSRVVALHRAA